MTHFVFCHGFGFDHRFWMHLAPYFAKERCSFVNLGYFQEPSEIEALSEPNIVGIGHSFGLCNLIAYNPHIRSLVGINSFTHFLGYNPALHPVRQRELTALMRQFAKNPLSTLEGIYHRCGTPSMLHKTLDLPLLLADLRGLSSNTMLPNVPTLILAAQDDIIVPPSIIDDNFNALPQATIEMLPHGQHGLGWNQPQIVYEKIMRFLGDCLNC